MNLSDVVGAVRRRWRVTAIILVLTAAAVTAFLVTRQQRLDPNKYLTNVLLDVPDAVQPGEDRNVVQAPPDDIPKPLLYGQERMAQSPELVADVLEAAGRPADDPSILFQADLDPLENVMLLTVVAPDAEASRRVSDEYVDAFLNARRLVHENAIKSNQQGLVRSLARDRDRLEALEAELTSRLGVLPPPIAGTDNEPALLPAGVDLDTVLLANQRELLYNKIEGNQLRYAELDLLADDPRSFAEVIDVPPTQTIVDQASSPLRPVAVIVLAGVLLAIAGGVAADRLDHKIRTTRAASAAFSAPVLSVIPAYRRGDGHYAVLERPGSPRSAAYRTLAATSIATDRLPKAIFVSTPQGDAHDEVAANFAAALATLGLQVALVATSSSQSWYLAPFTAPADGAADLPELLGEAHAGRLDGQVRYLLPTTELTPNLVVVPPGPEGPLTLPLDGLPPLLEALTRAGVDVTVLAGPPLLTEADATIVAWTTRTVLWAVEIGKTTRGEASEAAARSELAGVETFGVVVVGEPET